MSTPSASSRARTYCAAMRISRRSAKAIAATSISARSAKATGHGARTAALIIMMVDGKRASPAHMLIARIYHDQTAQTPCKPYIMGPLRVLLVWGAGCGRRRSVVRHVAEVNHTSKMRELYQG